MSNIETDERGILITCPKCGRRNRMKYEGLGKVFRCGQCKSELRPLGEPVDLSIERQALTKKDSLFTDVLGATLVLKQETAARTI